MNVPPLRWRVLSWALLILVLISILVPGVILAVLDQGLRVVDRHSHRYVDVYRSSCSGYRLSAQSQVELPKFDLGVLLLRAALRDNEALDFFKYDGRLGRAHCPATRRWMRNNGWPPLAELERRAQIPAPRLTLLITVGQDGLAEYPLHAGIGGGFDDQDFPLFSWDSERDRKMRDTLTAALPELKDPSIRRNIVERIRSFPATCREIEGGQGMSLTVTVAPAQRLPVAGRQHEVRKVTVWACLEKQIDECEWSGLGFTASRWMALLDACRKATQQHMQRGANLDGYVSNALEVRNMSADGLFRFGLHQR